MEKGRRASRRLRVDLVFRGINSPGHGANVGNGETRSCQGVVDSIFMTFLLVEPNFPDEKREEAQTKLGRRRTCIVRGQGASQRRSMGEGENIRTLHSRYIEKNSFILRPIEVE